MCVCVCVCVCACEVHLLVYVNIRWLMSFRHQDTPVYSSATSKYPPQAARLHEVTSHQVPPVSTKSCRPVPHGSYV
jgi:hypothetical protein